MRFWKVAAVLPALFVLTQCRFVTVLMPTRIAGGDVFTAQVQLEADPGVTNASTPVACVTVPDGWSVQGVTWTGTVGGAAITGTGSFDSAESDFVAAEFPRPDGTWSCWVGDLGDYVGGDRGTALFDIQSASGAGKHNLWFAAGRLEFNAANQYYLAMHTVAVDQPAEALDVWSQPTTPLADSSFYDVAHGPAGWIAVGNNGKKATSDDGKTWTASGFGGSVDWHGIAANDDRYVMVSTEAIQTSPDGMAWTQITPSEASANAIAYGGGRFVAAGDGGALYRSADGLTWTATTEASWGKLTDVAYDDVTGNWIVVGYGGFTKDTTILTSTDGITFVPGGINGAELDEAGAGGGVFVVSGGDATDYFWWTSTDGTNWSELSPHPGEVLYDGVDADGTFIGVGRKGSIWTAVGGNTFTLRAARTSQILRGVSYNAGRIVAVGDDGNIYHSTTTPAPALPDDCGLDDAVQLQTYEHSFDFDEGFGEHSWAISSGSLPTGIELADGILAGDPEQAGAFSFDVTLTDQKGDSDTASCTLTVTDGEAPDTDTDDTGPLDTGPRDTDDPGPGEFDTGCGCHSAPAGGMLLLPLVLLVIRRRP